ncbi:MAG: hypothetical protein IT304_12550 [Dehalococcoidia bacterium]|nr:hypothetical protein [Dehalococcoidia bacterium]
MFRRRPRVDDQLYGRLMTSFGRVVDLDSFVARPAAALAEKVAAEAPAVVAALDQRLYAGAAVYHLRLLAGSWIMVRDGNVPRATAEVFEEAVAWRFGPLVAGAGALAHRLSALARGEGERQE